MVNITTKTTKHPKRKIKLRNLNKQKKQYVSQYMKHIHNFYKKKVIL